MSSAIVWLIMDVMSVQHVLSICDKCCLTISVQRMFWNIQRKKICIFINVCYTGRIAVANAKISVRETRKRGKIDESV